LLFNSRLCIFFIFIFFHFLFYFPTSTSVANWVLTTEGISPLTRCTTVPIGTRDVLQCQSVHGQPSIWFWNELAVLYCKHGQIREKKTMNCFKRKSTGKHQLPYQHPCYLSTFFMIQVLLSQLSIGHHYRHQSFRHEKSHHFTKYFGRRYKCIPGDAANHWSPKLCESIPESHHHLSPHCHLC